ARPSKASPPAAALARAGEVSLQNPARPTAVEASPPFSSGTKRPRQDARRSNSDRRRRPSAESGHAESFDRSLSVSSQRFEVPCALDPSGALCKFSAWHTSLCHAGSPIRRNLPTRHFSRDRALGDWSCPDPLTPTLSTYPPRLWPLQGPAGAGSCADEIGGAGQADCAVWRGQRRGEDDDSRCDPARAVRRPGALLQAVELAL